MDRRKRVLAIFLIIAATVAALYFVYPTTPFPEFAENTRPWRLGLDLVGGSHLIYSVDMSQVNQDERNLVQEGLRDVIEQRVNLFGVSEPEVYTAKEGEDYRLIVSLAGIKDVAEAIKEIGETPLLDFREVDQVDQEQQTATFKQTPLTGRYITGAQLSFDQTTSEPIVLLEFDEEGANLFEEITGRNVGQPLAIFLDNALISAPTVNQKIAGGSAQITGMTVDEGRTLVQRFNAGALPAPISLINQQTVSATLGSDSLHRAIVAGLIGTAAIAVFMILYYGVMGVFAALALMIYILLTLAIFKLVPVTMTLSGVAGFLLSIGMAIDANILIFERTKEELKEGASRGRAIEEGFKRAWSSIRDSNITTIITAVILYYFTSSFVRGFALTLLIGVLVSMFSAITITRTLLRAFMSGKEK